MIYREYKYGYEKCYVREFDSVLDVKRFIDNEKAGNNFKVRKGGLSSINRGYDFTGTNSYQEAEDLFLHGWDYMAKELTKSIKVGDTGVRQRNKNAYGVAGYQACVPRYLQGMPDSMIYSKRVPVKDKVITVNKCITYNYKTKTNKILNESVKVLMLVRKLESEGYKVNLNIFNATERNGVYSFQKICIKRASNRLNIKQTAFPLVHPSMLRRIGFAVIERSRECDTVRFADNYGYPVIKHECFKDIMNGEYLIPAIVSEQEITDIEKYKVQ